MFRFVWLLSVVVIGPTAFVLAQARPATAPTGRPSTKPSTKPVEKGVTVSLDDIKSPPSSPGYFPLKAKISVDGVKSQMAFGLFLPPAYFTSTEPFPVVMTLHNKGMEGTNANGIQFEGLAALCARDDWDERTLNVKPDEPKPPTRPSVTVNLRTEARCIVIAPQCPHGKVMTKAPMPEIFSKLITEVGKLYRTDETRIYLTGFSYGGTCTWQIAEQIPDRFAAVVPLSTRATEDPAKTATLLKNIGVYTGCGTNEWSTPFCQTMRDAFTASGHPRFVYRQFEGGTHWCYPMIYTDPEFWNWLFAQRRPVKPTTRP